MRRYWHHYEKYKEMCGSCKMAWEAVEAELNAEGYYRYRTYNSFNAGRSRRPTLIRLRKLQGS